MGWEITPRASHRLLNTPRGRGPPRHRNGLADARGDKRPDFLRAHLTPSIARAPRA
jgi:hypothetical protein